MFKSPFSFNGRIRRTEFGLTYLAYIVVAVILQFAIFGSREDGSTSPVFFLFLLPMWFVLLAQGAKRCHDRGNSGWYQLIPFYGLWMLFADSEPGVNEYGPNPKGVGNETEFAFEKESQ